MSALQRVEVRFRGEKLATASGADEVSSNTLYRRSDGLYVIYMDEGDEAWLEDGHGDGLEEWQVRRLFPELWSKALRLGSLKA
jgi:hypothetical protein